MIPGAGLLLLLLPGIQLFLGAEGHAVDAGQHLVFLVALPVGARLLGDLEGFQALGVGQVGSDAHINVLALLEEADLGVLGQVADVLHLELLLALLHQLDGLGAGQDEGLDGQVLLGDLAHLLLDGSQVLVGELFVAQVYIVVEAVVGGGAVAKVSLGIEALDGLGHDVGGGVTQDVQFLVLGALGNGAVFVDDLHGGFPFFSGSKVNKKTLHPADSLHGMKRRYPHLAGPLHGSTRIAQPWGRASRCAVTGTPGRGSPLRSAVVRSGRTPDCLQHAAPAAAALSAVSRIRS